MWCGCFYLSLAVMVGCASRNFGRLILFIWTSPVKVFSFLHNTTRNLEWRETFHFHISYIPRWVDKLNLRNNNKQGLIFIEARDCQFNNLKSLDYTTSHISNTFQYNIEHNCGYIHHLQNARVIIIIRNYLKHTHTTSRTGYQ